jgi:hypothetical protein
VAASSTASIEDDHGVVDEVHLRRDPLGKSISAEALRALPVGRIVRHAIDAAAIPATFEHGRIVIQVIGVEGTPMSAEVAEAIPPRRRPRMTNDQRQERWLRWPRLTGRACLTRQ